MADPMAGRDDDEPGREGLDTQALRASLENRMFGQAALPTVVGRFEILRSVGRGGMGAVYAAHDPQLDRKVALKLLHNDRGGGGSGPTEGLLAEARALARLNHANVVTVYETGVHDGALFLAMEFLDGGTLAAWAREHPARTRTDARATVRLYLRAGAGLVAAHEAGLVHRDFKPANVLLGTDGRLVVADFGLARGSFASASAAELVSFEEDASELRMTTATLAGTPAYMSPEQFEGVVDTRSDQFSFCVSLWEALFGERPFDGKTPTALHERMLGGELSRGSSSAPIPREIERALRRGLSTDPKDRWPSMEPLLAALAHDPAARVRRTVLVLAGGGALGLAAWQPWAHGVSPCHGGDDALKEVWGGERREEVARAITGSRAEFGRQTQERVERAIDDYAALWHDIRTESCEASLVRQERSGEAYDLTMQCLNTRRAELGAVTSILAEGDVTVVERAVAAVTALSPLEPCTDLEALRENAPQDPARAAELDALEQERVRIRALMDTGQDAKATDFVRDAVAAAREADDRRGLARALELQAKNMQALGGDGDVQGVLEASLRAAAAAGEEEIEARLWPVLISSVGSKEPERVAQWRLAAETALLRAGDRPLDQAALHHAFGNVASAAHAYDEAEREHLAGLALKREHVPTQKLEIADSLNMLAGVHYNRREVPEAKSILREVLAAYTDALGSDHPNVAKVQYNLAGVLFMGGEYEEAVVRYEDSIRIYGQAYGPRSPRLHGSMLNLGGALARLGRFEESIEKTQLAIEIIIENSGEDNPMLASAYNTLGAAYDGLGRVEESLAVHEKGVALMERDGPSEGLATSVSNLALMQDAVGRHSEAAANFVRSIEMFEEVFGPEHPDLWRPLAMLARLYRKQGNIEKALPLAERAVRVLEGHDIQPVEVADARFELARILRLASTDEERAVELATSARDLWQASDWEKEAAEIDVWLEEPAGE